MQALYNCNTGNEKIFSESLIEVAKNIEEDNNGGKKRKPRKKK